MLRAHSGGNNEMVCNQAHWIDGRLLDVLYIRVVIWKIRLIFSTHSRSSVSTFYLLALKWCPPNLFGMRVCGSGLVHLVGWLHEWPRFAQYCACGQITIMMIIEGDKTMLHAK